jgi:hypothetical protein
MQSLDAFSRLTITIGDEHAPIVVRKDGDRVEIDLPDMRTGLYKLRHDLSGVYATLNRLQTNLSHEAIPVSFRLKGVEVARLGPQARPGLLSYLLGIAPARLRLRGLLRASLRRR